MLPWLIGTATSALTLPSDLQQRLTGNLSVLVFGVLLIVVMLVWPGGIAGIRRSRRGRRRPEGAAAGAAPGSGSGGGSAEGRSGTATDAEHSARAGSAGATPAADDSPSGSRPGPQHPLDSVPFTTERKR